MKRIFQVRLWAGEGSERSIYEEGGRRAAITLPATSYELLDALDKLRLEAGASPHWRITTYHAFNDAIREKQGSLYELNALAKKLSELDDRQKVAYDGLRMMERRTTDAPIALSRLIDLVYSTDCCHVVDKALDDARLGQFCAEKGFVPGAEDLPDDMFALLNFEKIGQEHRWQTGGVIVKRTTDHPGGYVERYREPMQVYQTLDLMPKEPDYVFRLRVARGYYAPPASDCKASVQLKLPATPETLEAVLSDLKVNDWQETVWFGLDCQIPLLTDMVYDIGVNDAFTEVWMDRLNSLAQQVADMSPKTLTAYKALLSAVDCKNMQDAAQLVDALHDHTFSPEYGSPVEVAKGELAAILCDEERELLEPCLDLEQYGEALIEDCGGVLTDYGLIKREDRHPVQDWEPAQDSHVHGGGMTLG